MGKVNSLGQASFEYLLVVLGFFAMMGVIIPVMIDSTNSFLSSSDELLAKRISSELSETASLFTFLADGSKKEFNYFPAKEILVYSNSGEIVFEANKKQFFVKNIAGQFFPKETFSAGFTVFIKKENGKLVFDVQKKES